MAERQRFELWEGGYPSTVFKTAALNRSATSPVERGIIPENLKRYNTKVFYFLK
jgi:hypothetical protein